MNFLVRYFRHPLEDDVFPGEPHRTWTDDEEWPLSLEGIGDRQGLDLKKKKSSEQFCHEKVLDKKQGIFPAKSINNSS